MQTLSLTQDAPQDASDGFDEFSALNCSFRRGVHWNKLNLIHSMNLVHQNASNHWAA